MILQNTSHENRKDAGVTITKNELGTIAEQAKGKLPALKDKNGNFIPTQVDDLDGDGNWDELFILTDLQAMEVVKASLRFISQEEYPLFEVRTNIRFARKDQDYKEVTAGTREKHATNSLTGKVWQMEGIAWENDKIGFRNYFDRRNGMDIYGKVTSRMVLDEVGYKNNPSYHVFNPDWGVDVLRVDNSLGAGSIAYYYKDSLYRVGDNGTGTCRVLTEGPLRSIFRFEFMDWEINDQKIKVTHDISIEAGKYYFENAVSYSGTNEKLELVSGIVNIKSKELYEIDSNKLYSGFFTHDLQAEDTSLLGMGLLIATKDFIGNSVAPEEGRGITKTYCIHLKTSINVPAKFRFYSVWSRESEKWKTAEGFRELLETEAEFMANPVMVKVEKD